MKGYNIKEELYTKIAHRTLACTLLLENGYEITETYCIDINDLIYEEQAKQKAFKLAYAEYLKMVNAIERQVLFALYDPGKRGEHIGKESV